VLRFFHVKYHVSAAFFSLSLFVIRLSRLQYLPGNERRRNQKALKILSRFLCPHVYAREELPNTTMRRETWAAIEGIARFTYKVFLKKFCSGATGGG
jgi:hypothetical protein